MKLTNELKEQIRDIKDSSDLCDVVRAISRVYLEEYDTYSSARRLSDYNNCEVAQSFKDLKDIDFDEGPHMEKSKTVDLIREIVLNSGKGELRASYEKALEIFVN